MKIRTILLSIVLIAAMPVLSYGQVGNILRNRLNKALDRKVEEKVDTVVSRSARDAQAAEKEAGKAVGVRGEESQQRQGSGINLGGIMGGKVASGYSESYSFNNNMYMVTEMHDGKNVVNMDYYIYWNNANLNGGIESKMTKRGRQIARWPPH